MVDGVVLVGVLVPAFICMFLFMISKPGSKGLTKEYKTKSGIKHTAKKERTNYIV